MLVIYTLIAGRGERRGGLTGDARNGHDAARTATIAPAPPATVGLVGVAE